jgi:hypothetical protein
MGPIHSIKVPNAGSRPPRNGEVKNQAAEIKAYRRTNFVRSGGCVSAKGVVI